MAKMAMSNMAKMAMSNMAKMAMANTWQNDNGKYMAK